MKLLEALLALFACAFIPLQAADLSDLTYRTTGGKVAITDCNTAATGELVIPDTIEGNPVTSIGVQAFDSCTSLTSIAIDNGVTSIGDYAFEDCRNLTSITFMGAAPTVGNAPFLNVADGAVALVAIADLSSFGDFGTGWNGLIVGMSYSAMISLLVQRDARRIQVAYDAAAAPARTAGQGDAISDLASYSLFTEDQIHVMPADSTIGMNDAGNVFQRHTMNPQITMLLRA
jgi:hypothetical protein